MAPQGPYKDDQPGGSRFLPLFLLLIVAYFNRFLPGAMIETIKADLDLSDTEAGAITGLAFSILFVIAGIPLGRLVDTTNRKRLIAMTMAIWAAGVGACGQAQTMFALFLARMTAGAGEVTLNPAIVSILNDASTGGRRDRSISLLSLTVYVGGGLAILAGGLAATASSGWTAVLPLGLGKIAPWRLMFYLASVMGIVVVLAMLFLIREPVRRGPTRHVGGATAPKVTSYLREHALLYTLLLGGYVSWSFFQFAGHYWLPAILMRTFPEEAEQVPLLYSLAYVLSGMAGALSAYPLMQGLRRLGFVDYPLVLCVIALMIMLIGGLTFLFAPNLATAMVIYAVSGYFSAVTLGSVMLVIANITPPAMIGLIISMYMVMMNVTGGMISPVLIGFLSDVVFGPERIRWAFVSSAALFLPLGVGLLIAARGRYRALLFARAGEHRR